jgi:crossover junction endodeoxyribonuclease RuvC
VYSRKELGEDAVLVRRVAASNFDIVGDAMILGIDPGLSGGAALISQDRKFVEALSFHKSTPGDIATWLGIHRKDITIAYLEAVNAMPRQGVVSMFKFGMNYGLWQGFLTSTKIPFQRVYPLKWQTAMSCRTGGNKNISKARAQELFPHLKITHAIADALLIAEYGRRQVIRTGTEDL